MVWGAFWKLKKVWKAEQLSLKLKLEIYSTAVLSILLYGCKSWIISDGLEKRIDSFATKCYRIILGISYKDHVSNQDESRVNKVSLHRTVLQWFGHMLRHGDEELVKRFALFEPSENLDKVKTGQKKLTYKQGTHNIQTGSPK